MSCDCFQVDRDPSANRADSYSHGRGRLPVRSGATAVEAAMVLSFSLLAIFWMLDITLMVLRKNALVSGAQRLAREAIVRGELAAGERGSWGPAAGSGLASESGEMPNVVRQILPTMRPDDVSYHLSWPDGGLEKRMRVVATLNYSHQPIVPFLTGGATFQLSGTSTMRIMH